MRKCFVGSIVLVFLVLALSAFPGLAQEPVWELHYSIVETVTTTMEGQDVGTALGTLLDDSASGESTDTAASSEGEPSVEVSKRELVLILAPQMLSIEDGEDQAIYDFTDRKLYIRDAKGALTPTSLYSDIGFRQAELRNRLFLRQALAAGGAEDTMGSVAQIETLFSLRAPDLPETVVETNEDDGESRYFLDGESVVSYRPSSQLLPEALRKTQQRFLLYGTHLHPAVLDALAAKSQIPERLLYQYRLVGKHFEVELDLIKASAVTTDLGTTVRSSEVHQAGEDLSKNLARGILAADPITPPSAEVYSSRGQAALEKGAFLDAMLFQMEQLLVTGGVDQELVRSILATGVEDEPLVAYLQASKILEENPEGALQQLTALLELSEQTKHYLRIPMANALSYLGRTEEAIESFTSALQTNPYLTGVYKDLGDIHYSSFDTATAWLFWDAARKIAPDHGMLQTIHQLEAFLEENNPRFF